MHHGLMEWEKIRRGRCRVKQTGLNMMKQVEQTLEKGDFFKGYKRPEYFKTSGKCECKDFSHKQGERK